jgi:galactonate dehydratase
VPRYVLGSDPFEIERLVGRMYREDFERAGAVVMTGIALVEMACWGLIGKSLNQPVYRLLGGAVRDKIKAYANGWYTVERTPKEFHAAAKRAVAKGYRALKFDPCCGWVFCIAPRSRFGSHPQRGCHSRTPASTNPFQLVCGRLAQADCFSKIGRVIALVL